MISMVEKGEFLEYMKDWRHFYELADTQNLMDGEKMYNFCLICGYHGRIVSRSLYELEALDRKIIEHIWKAHTSIAAQKVLQWMSNKVAAAKGQKRLEI